MPVPGLSRLDGGIDQAFASTHCVEKELGGGEPTEEGIADKSFGVWVGAATFKVRQGAVLKPRGNTIPSEGLLSDTRNHLRHVKVTALGPTPRHHHRCVEPRQLHTAYGREVSVLWTDLECPTPHLGNG